MDELKLKRLIDLYPTTSNADIARELKIHATTVEKYAELARKSGMKLRKLPDGIDQSGARQVIKSMLKRYPELKK